MGGSPRLLSRTTSGRRLVSDWPPSGDGSCEGSSEDAASVRQLTFAPPPTPTEMVLLLHGARPSTRAAVDAATCDADAPPMGERPAANDPRRPLSYGSVRRNLRIPYGSCAREASTAALVEFRCGDLPDSVDLNRGWQERAELGAVLGSPAPQTPARPRKPRTRSAGICGTLRTS
jgi:hypothetical protein